MNEIEIRATLLLQGSPARKGIPLTYDISRAHAIEALCRAIEAHEADKHRFSEAVEAAIKYGMPPETEKKLSPFIIPQTDPLVEVMRATGMDCLTTTEGGAELLKRAADRLGYDFAIVAKGGE